MKKTVSERMSEFEKAAKPLFDYMIDNCGPHDLVIVDIHGARLAEGVFAVPSHLSESEE